MLWDQQEPETMACTKGQGGGRGAPPTPAESWSQDAD